MASRSLGTRIATAGSALGAKPPLDKHKSSTRFVLEVGPGCGGRNQGFSKEARMGNGPWLSTGAELAGWTKCTSLSEPIPSLLLVFPPHCQHC